METPALTRAGGSGRSHTEGTPPTGTPVWSLFGVRVPTHPQILQPLFPHWHPLPGACHLHCSPLHPSLLGAIAPFIKTVLKFSRGLSTYTVPLCDTVCRLMTIFLSPSESPTQGRPIPGTAQNHSRPILDP